jgi:putative ABC transport system permease protein
MNWMTRLFRRRSHDAEVLEEIESHIAMRTEQNRQHGLSAEEATDRAHQQFGNATLIRERIYHFNGFGVLDALVQDVRSGFRMFQRYPGVTSLALLCLALGLGANTLSFSFVNVLLFRDLPYPKSDRLVIVDDSITPEECLTLLDHSDDAFDNIGCFADGAPSGASISSGGTELDLPEHLLGQRFTAGVGRTLEASPLLGRWFTDANERGSGDRVTVISYPLWQRRFHGDPGILGTPLRIDGEEAIVIGVMPPEFEFLASNVDYWLPIAVRQLGTQERVLGVVARLRDGVTVDQGQSVVDALISRRIGVSTEGSASPRLFLRRLDQFTRTQFHDTALILQGTVTFVLLLACVNVAGLLLMQAIAQQKELAIRAALGSGTWRIVRQVTVHSLMLFSAGGVLALAAGWAGTRLLVNVLLTSVTAYGTPRGGLPHGILNTGIDGAVLAFTFAISLVCGLLAAIAPALHVSNAHPLNVLRESNPGYTSGTSLQKLRSIFATIQIALAFVLLVGAALMLNGLTRSLNQNIGFPTADLLTVRLQLPEPDYPNGGDLLSSHEQARLKNRFNTEEMREQLAAIGGVSSASGIAIYPPLSGAVNLPVQLEDRPSAGEQRSQFIPILPDYFHTLQVAIIQGREFELEDNPEGAPVAIINETAARLWWPDESPLGKRVRIQSSQLPSEPPRRVVGVVTEVSQYSGQQSRPQLYVPFSQLQTIKDARLQTQLRDITFIVKTKVPAGEMTPAFRAAIERADRGQAISSVRTMHQTAFAASERRGNFVALTGLFGVIALMLSVIGVYGVVASLVNQRFNEFGIRIALGANPRQILRLVIRHGCVLMGTGMAAGVAVSLAITRAIRCFLFGTSPTDPVTFILAVMLLGTVGLFACYLPARRASRIDAIVALRRH